jgi:heme-degrading monooxygenase HmoA
MIVRTWRGRADLSRSHAYPEHFRRNVLPALRTVEGFLGASLLRHDGPDEIEFVVLTRWTSMEAIRAFAGPDADKAVVEPEAVAALIDFDRTVRHYTVAEETFWSA